jgi:nucleotide-binding universal stress UspA family protein
MFEKILVGMDFSSCAEHALEVARRRFPAAQRLLVYIAEQDGGTPSAAELLDPGNSPEAQAERARVTLDALLEVGETAAAVVGRPAKVILTEARSWGADLIVLGTHGRRGLAHLVFGSVAEDVVRTSPVPVLTVREMVATLESEQPRPHST